MGRNYEQILHDIDVQDKLLNKIQHYITTHFVLEHDTKVNDLYNYLEQLKGQN